MATVLVDRARSEHVGLVHALSPEAIALYRDTLDPPSMVTDSLYNPRIAATTPMMLTNNTRRTTDDLEIDAANPRVENEHGHSGEVAPKPAVVLVTG